jgi:hypothetical protein
MESLLFKFSGCANRGLMAQKEVPFSRGEANRANRKIGGNLQGEVRTLDKRHRQFNFEEISSQATCFVICAELNSANKLLDRGESFQHFCI